MGNSQYLILSVSLSAVRNITSKKTAVDTKNTSQFFLSQTLLFGSSTILLLILNLSNSYAISGKIILFGIIYGILLISSQWMFALSLKSGATSICSVIYSLGFIIPTLSGKIFWNEDFNFINIFGILAAVAVILLSAKKEKNIKSSTASFLPFIIIALFSSGGLGIMQKVIKYENCSNETGTFLIIAFLFAFICSVFSFLICTGKQALKINNSFYPILTGLCFGGANFCNTVLAGKIRSAVFFPLQNISTILVTAMLGVLFFNEKITKKTTFILFLGIIIILLFSFN